jgi:predicted flap endonuclease-1-like 5' DNA nuclease
MAQSNTGSDWNWFLIFIIFVVVLTVALIVQAIFSKEESDELAFHEEEDHHEVEVEVEPESEPEDELEEEAEPEAPPEPDDLKKLEGIGPKVANLLNENGITTFAQLADTPVEKLEEILEANKLQMIHPGSWPKQARLAADGNWEAFEKLQDELHGGREK